MAKRISDRPPNAYTERERSLVDFARRLLDRLQDPSRPPVLRRWADYVIDRYLYLVFHPVPDRLRESIRLSHFGKPQQLTAEDYLDFLGLPDGVQQPDRVPLVALAATRHGDPRLAALERELFHFGQATGLFPLDEVEKLVVLGQSPRLLMAEIVVEPIDYTQAPCIALRLFHPDLVWDLKPLLEMAFPVDEALELTLNLSRRLPGRGEQAGRRRRRYITPEKRIMYLTCWLLTKAGGGERTSYRAQRMCENEFSHGFDPEDYKDQLAKILAEFEYGQEYMRAMTLHRQENPPVISLYGLPS